MPGKNRNNVLDQQNIIRTELERFKVILEESLEKYPGQMHSLLSLVHEHLFEKNLGLAVIHEMYGRRNNNITTRFRDEVAMGIGEYILSKRMEAAAWLLRYTNVEIHLIAQSVCYEVESFSNAFKRWYDCTPREYRRRHGGGVTEGGERRKTLKKRD
jgi:AraC-like DNA-binding protein